MAQNNPGCYRSWPEHWLRSKASDPSIEDMTPAQIHQKYGDAVSSYILRLRGEAEMWKHLYTEKLL